MSAFFASKKAAEARLAALLMDDMPVESCGTKMIQFPSDWYAKFHAARAEFLRSLDDSITELAMLNLTSPDFSGLLSGTKIPENLSVKFRKPIIYGGEISPENMFLMTSFPFGLSIDIFMAEQIGASEVWYPNPEKKIYVSAQMLAGGAGGNATTDRLAQNFAQMASSRGNE